MSEGKTGESELEERHMRMDRSNLVSLRMLWYENLFLSVNFYTTSCPMRKGMTESMRRKINERTKSSNVMIGMDLATGSYILEGGICPPPFSLMGGVVPLVCPCF